MKPLYTELEFKSCKSLDLLACECYQCSSTFYRNKKEINLSLKGNTKYPLKYCSKACQFKSQITSQEVFCLNCNKSIKKRLSQIQKFSTYFCSKSCSVTFHNKNSPKRKTKRKCVKCDEIVSNYKKSRCDLHQKEYLETRYNYIQDLTLADYWKRKCLEGLHNSCKNVHIRNLARTRFKNLRKLPCYNCGYDKHVELCHIRSISSFPSTAKIKEINSPDNIIQLCPNCHWEFDKKLLALDLSSSYSAN